MSAIGGRLAGYGGSGQSNGVVAPSLYNTNGQKPPPPHQRQNVRTQSMASLNDQKQVQPNSSLQRLYDSQPRNNGVNFKPPSAQHQSQKQSLYQKQQSTPNTPVTPLWAQQTTTPSQQPPFNPSFNPNSPTHAYQQNSNHPQASPNMSKSSTYTQFPTSDLYSTSTTGNMYYSPKPEKSAAAQAIELAEKVATEAAKTFRVTKQIVGERYGQATRTIDQEVQEKMQDMLHRRKKYTKLHTLADSLTKDYAKFAQSQLNFGECLKDVGVNTPELHDMLIHIGDTQSRIAQESQQMQLSLSRFSCGIQTLVEKTMQDSQQSSARLQQIRLEYDAIRQDLESQRHRNMGGVAVEMQHKFQQIQDNYAKGREELLVKLQLLDENRVRVLKDNSLALDQATANYAMACEKIVDPVERARQEEAKHMNQNDTTPAYLQEPFIEDELEISESVNNINLNGSNSTHSTPSQAQIPQNRTPTHNGNAASETPKQNIPAHEMPLEDDDYGLHESAL